MNPTNASSIDWKFWIGDVLIPIATFVIGLFVGKSVERRKITNKAKIRGNSNIVSQGCTFEQKEK